MVALRAAEVPVTLIGGLVQLMKLLPSLAALRHEDALAHPAERSHARAQFGQVPGRCHPAFI